MFNLEWFEPSLLKFTIAVLGIAVTASAADLPTKKYLDLKSIKALVAAAFHREPPFQEGAIALCQSLGKHQAFRLTIICLISPIAWAGFRPLGQVLAQFMMVWQR